MNDLILPPVGSVRPGNIKGVSGNAPSTTVDLFHRDDDLDKSPFAHHHTLGIGPNQAARGNHEHEGLIEPEWENWVPAYRSLSGVAVVCTTNQAKYLKKGGLCFFTFDVTMSAGTTAGSFLMISLPVPPEPPLYNNMYMGSGRERIVSGSMLSINLDTTIAPAGTWAIMLYYNNGTTTQSGRTITGHGFYRVAI